MQTIRIERVRELLKRSLGELLRREFVLDECGLMNVNEVELTSDLRQATAYVGVVGTKEQKRRAGERLEQHRIRLQHQVAQDVVLRHAPLLKFVLDDSIEKGNRVLAIIEEIEKEKPAS
ncbi:MAG: 30S ribosome-binding factor RbfA [Verrucomicrobia bacterium]|nr:30S ribosome-binding factor RbfA [Verrucomicrobiota bacterium]